MSILDRTKNASAIERYNALEKVLKNYSLGAEAPMDFYRAVFPIGSFGSDLESGVKGESYGIFGIIPDNEMYKKMKRWIDKKNNNEVYIKDETYSLNEIEQERMMKFYIMGSRVNELLKADNNYIREDWVTALSDEEFEKQLDAISDLCGFGEVREVPNIKYPKKVVLSENASRSAQQKHQLSYSLQCARAEYEYDKRYAKLDAQFGARCFRQISPIDDKYTSYNRIQAKWMYYQRVDDSLRQIGMCFGQQSCLMAPADYFGKKPLQKTIGRLYAIAIDVDDMKPEKLEETFKYDFFGFKPTYIVQSGTGMHFYYILDYPLPMLYSYRPKIRQLKMALAKYFVNADVSYSHTKPDPQEWDKQFRVVGSKSKVSGKFVNAYKVGGVWKIEDLVHLVNKGRPSEKIGEFESWELKGKSGMTRAEWLAKTAEIKKEREEKYGKGTKLRVGGRGYYDSWIERILDDDSLGSRFHRTCILYSDAAFCGISFSEVDDFATTTLYHYYNQPQVAKGNPFLMSDIKSASKFYNSAERYKSFSLDKIYDMTGILLPRAKRNYNSQDVHLKMARFMRDEVYGKKDTWREGNGRPVGSKDSKQRERTADSKEQLVRAYLQEHPDAKKVDVIRETGLSKPTVYKWYDKIKEEQKG